MTVVRHPGYRSEDRFCVNRMVSFLRLLDRRRSGGRLFVDRVVDLLIFRSSYCRVLARSTGNRPKGLAEFRFSGYCYLWILLRWSRLAAVPASGHRRSGEEGAGDREVEDEGLGFDPSAVSDGNGRGERVDLSSMSERVALLGGELEITSKPGRDTSLVAEAPL